MGKRSRGKWEDQRQEGGDRRLEGIPDGVRERSRVGVGIEETGHDSRESGDDGTVVTEGPTVGSKR